MQSLFRVHILNSSSFSTNSLFELSIVTWQPGIYIAYKFNYLIALSVLSAKPY